MVFQGTLRAEAGVGHASLVDFCNPRATCEHDCEPSEPRAPHAWSPKRAAFDRGWLRLSLAGERGQPGGIGPGAARTDVTPFAWRPPKRSLASGGLAPTQIDPGTPCRGLVMPPAGVSPVVSGARLYSTRLQRDRLRQGAEAPNRRANGIACAIPPLQGRLSSPLAKENSIRRTRGAFHHRTSRHVSGGLDLLVHRLSPDCGNRGWPGRLFDRPARGGMTMPCPRAG